MGKRISVFVLDREGLTSISRFVLRFGAHLSQICVVVVVADFTFLSGLAVVNRSLDHGLDETHASHDTTHLYELVDELSFEASRSDMIAPKVALEVDVVSLSFGWEGSIICSGCLLLVVRTLA